ncbi:unnamed protein product [Cylindrotheca closterium]|uniref:DUS-like FMN-binding domain-containing protein n=1 Tax=Cylindrotheca closterium TaxID=2856 RepID=A0AAD2G319_9STRA|nr:unnamed protein product [Cylindrotheca closterium]
MAPMVAASDYPFRYLLRKYDVDLTFTQMLHCKNYINDETFRLSHLDLWEAGAKYPDLLRSQLSCLGDFPPPMGPQEGDCASPLIVQLAGNQPDLLVQQALMILEHTDGKVTGFDLNLGCPQQIAKKKGSYGAFLMERDLDLVCNILSSLRDSVPETTTVSAKIRLPTDDETLCYRIPKLVNTGINFLTIHGRTLVENKTKVGAAHVDRIKLAIDKAHEVNPNLPVIANGGMETYEDIQEVMWKTGASAAMSSEALLETPNVFSPKSSGLSPRERLTQQISFATEYLDICKNVAPPLPGVLGNGGSFKIVRGHLFKFLYRYLNEHTDLRDRLGGDQKLQTLGEASNLVDELAERCLKLSDDELLRCASSAPESSWYRRHRKGNRRVHQKEVRVDSSLVPSGSEEETIESRKQEIRDRISQMKERKAAREASAANRFVA